jgi:hypothetical protein
MWRHITKGVMIGLLSGLACTACTRVKALEGSPQDLQVLYQEAMNIPQPAPVLQTKGLPVGPEAPYTPIMQPPQVQRVWVPDHLNTDGDLVSGHWVYLLLEPARWFLETHPTSPTPMLRVPLAPPVSPPPAASASPMPGGLIERPAGIPGVTQASPPAAPETGAIPPTRRKRTP